MPRMHGDEAEQVFEHDASMRPRRECLGCKEDRWDDPAAWARFNEAEARMPRMRMAGQGHGKRAQGASMRPRRECLGCPSGEVGSTLPRSAASMRPRRECLGCGDNP